MASLKSMLKDLLPEPVLERWRYFRFQREQRAAKGRRLDDVFGEIYETGAWDRDDNARYHSGPGSRAEITAAYEDFVAGIINSDASIETLLDIGCGDFQVSRRILAKLNRPISYIGCDVAANVVAYNQTTFGVPGKITFLHLNAAAEPVPMADLVTIREVFQHLSNDLIAATLANLQGKVRQAIITESVFVSPRKPNVDLVSGYRTRDGVRSGVYLDLPPYNLRVLERFETETPKPDEVIRTLRIALD